MPISNLINRSSSILNYNFVGRKAMRLLLSAVVSFGLFFTSYSQSDYAEDLVTEKDADSDEIKQNNETLFSDKITFGRNVDQKSSTISTQDITELERKQNEENIENEDVDSCGNPPDIEYTKVLGKNNAPYAIGTQLSYTCIYGYSADGASHSSQCLQSREGTKPTWTDPNIICIPRSCGDPGFVSNSYRTGSRFTFPNSVYFECEAGYELRGSNIRYCQVNGRWSGSLPRCEKVFCDSPDHPEHGRVSYSSLEYGSKLKYECDVGYLLKHHLESRSCTENGTWSGPEPLCLEAKCDAPLPPEHGSLEIVGGSPRIGSIVFFSCESGRRLIGSRMSKCLEIGEWTFPPPKCVDPCNVPHVMNGQIGKYEKKRRTEIFTALKVGDPIDDRDELYLRCANKYEAMGENTKEMKVECKKGQWRSDPICKPAKCRTEPPTMQNGLAERIGRELGQYVVYSCSENYVKTKFGNVTCHFGEWRGVTPICTDKRCYVDRIQFPGLVKDKRNIYFPNESYRPVCQKGYEVAVADIKLKCNNGVWKGHSPPCKAESCLKEPPPIQHGRIKSYSDWHSSVVQYECLDGFILDSSSQVQCLFGEWKHSVPKCIDSRCYFEKLMFKHGMMAPLKDPVEDGEVIDVRCASGFSPLNIKPICSKGKWNEYQVSPCQQDNCLVPKINSGALTQYKEHRGLIWTTYYYEEVPTGKTITAGNFLYVICTNEYTFQGQNLNSVKTYCIEGKWKPTPVCLPYGTVYNEKEIPVTDNLEQTAKVSDEFPLTTFSSAPEPENPLVKTTNIEKASKPTQITDRKSQSGDNCFCIYQGSNDLVAYAGHDLLKAGMKVKPNCSVKFYCKNIGVDRLMGPTEIKCTDCKTWLSSEYPDCVQPNIGDALLAFDPSFHFLPGGILSVAKGLSPQITCSGNSVTEYPEWKSDVDGTLWTSFQALHEDNGEQFHVAVLELHETDIQHSGFYSCGIKGYKDTKIQIQVKLQCRKFEESEDYDIYYDIGLNVNSSAIFKCKDKKKKIEGSGTLTCMQNGEWSGTPPKCVFPGCPLLNETDGMRIVYTDGQKIGSSATFHCTLPRMRKGNVKINCLSNGEWSGIMPSCSLKGCHIDNLMEQLPENVVPDMKNASVIDGMVSHGSELPLLCEGGLRLSQPESVKCNHGLWEVPTPRCIQGCNSVITSDFDLIVRPKKDFYRFGEMVELSCAPGLVLTAKVEILMCLNDGWSEKKIPSCTDPKKF